MSKRDDIKRLVKLVENREKAIKMAEDMLATMRKGFEEAGLSSAFWDDLRTEMLRIDNAEYELVVDVYDRWLPHDVVLWAIALLESQEGKWFFDVMNDISRDMLMVGAAKGDRVMKTVMARHGLLPD